MNTLTENNASIPIATMGNKELEKNLIQSMAGNYRVSFRFAETFSPDRNYQFHDRHLSSAKEVVLLLEDSEDLISLQHLLYVGPTVIKHWRQDWIYENRELLVLQKNNEWKKTKLSEEAVKGTWTQKVYQVDDCPRYEGLGTWVHVDGRHFWESSTDAALPRREITKRNDYNVLRRHSHIELFENGDWVIDQDNEKIFRNENHEDTVVCLEKGIESFTAKKYDPATAKNWWEDNKAFWKDVREIWSEIIASRDEVIINDDEALYFAQSDLGSQFSGNQYDSEKARAAIKTLLKRYVSGL